MASRHLPTHEQRQRWPLERLLFALAGAMTRAGIALAVLVSPWLLAPTAFVGLSRWMYVTARDCPTSLFLRRCGVREACP